MTSKMKLDRFSLRFNMNDPQQQRAAEILNRQGRQKAQFLTKAILYYMENYGASHPAPQTMVEEQSLEQAILAVLTKNPDLFHGKETESDNVNAPDLQESQVDAMEPLPPLHGVMSQEGLSAIQKTLASFRKQ